MGILRRVALLCFITTTIARAGPPPTTAPADVPVVCEAVTNDDRERTNAPFEIVCPITLVVVADGGPPVPPNAPERPYGTPWHLRVERVLYGSVPPGQTVLDVDYGWGVLPGRNIYALVATYESGGAAWQLKYQLPADPVEVRAQSALATARLDYTALSARSIFIGTEMSGERAMVASVVRVVKPLTIGAPAAGSLVHCYVNECMRSDRNPVIHREPMVYFVAAVNAGPHAWDDEKDRAGITANEATYDVPTRLPADLEPAIVAALKRRDLYPVEPGSENGKPSSRRTIGFPGSVDAAVDMLGSDSEAVGLLAGEALVRAKAMPAMLAAIDRDLLRFDNADYGGYRRLHRLIGLVQLAAGPTADADLGARIDRMLDHLGRGPSEPALPARKLLYYVPEESREDVNHALLWLLSRLSPSVAADGYGVRLRTMRDAAQGRCRDELALAVDATRIDDNLELSAALSQHGMRRIAQSALAAPVADPPTTKPTLAQQIKQYFVRPTEIAVFFTADGRAVRTIGPDPVIRRWDADTLAAVDAIPTPTGTAVGAYRPTDGRYVLCPDAECFNNDRPYDAPPPPTGVKVLDADQGKVVGTYPMPVHWTYSATSFLWPAGPEVVCGDDGTLRRFNLMTGNVVETIKLDQGWGKTQLAEDGRTVYSPEVGSKSWIGYLTHYDLVTHRTSERQSLTLPIYFSGRHGGLVPDGHHFYLADPNVMIFDRTSAQPTLVRPFHRSDLRTIAFAPGGGRFAVVTEEDADAPARWWPQKGRAVLRVHDSVTGKTLSAADLPDGRVDHLVFSPDGRHIAVTATLRLPHATQSVVELYDCPG